MSLPHATAPRLERLQKTGARRGRRRPARPRPPAFVLDRAQFFRSYLFGFLFWIGLGVGCLGLAMLHHLTGGAWGLVHPAHPRGGGADAAR